MEHTKNSKLSELLFTKYLNTSRRMPERSF